MAHFDFDNVPKRKPSPPPQSDAPSDAPSYAPTDAADAAGDSMPGKPVWSADIQLPTDPRSASAATEYEKASALELEAFERLPDHVKDEMAERGLDEEIKQEKLQAFRNYKTTQGLIWGALVGAFLGYTSGTLGFILITAPITAVAAAICLRMGLNQLICTLIFFGAFVVSSLIGLVFGVAGINFFAMIIYFSLGAAFGLWGRFMEPPNVMRVR